jgi:uncharacterized membrane protein YphA (DoxX/SURF4 family)
VVYVLLTCRCLLALMFAVSVFSKVRSRKAVEEFVTWLASLPIAAALRHRSAAVALLGGETLVVGCLLVPAAVHAGLVLAGLMLAIFATGIYLTLRQGVRAPCKCFGTSSAALGWPHFYRNVALSLAAFAGCLIGADHGARLAGVVISLAAAVLLLIPVIFLDDLQSLFAQPPGSYSTR